MRVDDVASTAVLQRRRLLLRAGFFALFVLAPPLDLLRLDLHLGHFILLGQAWTLGIDDFAAGRVSAAQAAFNLVLRGLVPIALLLGTLVWVSWRWGRLYCGWLCPHFSVVELINSLMRRASNRPTLWERRPLPERRPDGASCRRTPVTGGGGAGRRGFRAAVGRHPADLPAAARRDLPQPAASHADAQPGNLLSAATSCCASSSRSRGTCSVATAALSACCRASSGWSTAAPWWWVSMRGALARAPTATRPATMPVRCGCARAASSAPCSPAPSARRSSPPARRCSGMARRAGCCTG